MKFTLTQYEILSDLVMDALDEAEKAYKTTEAEFRKKYPNGEQGLTGVAHYAYSTAKFAVDASREYMQNLRVLYGKFAAEEI